MNQAIVEQAKQEKAKQTKASSDPSQIATSNKANKEAVPGAKGMAAALKSGNPEGLIAVSPGAGMEVSAFSDGSALFHSGFVPPAGEEWGTESMKT